MKCHEIGCDVDYQRIVFAGTSFTEYHVCMVITYSKSMDQPGKIANPVRGQLNREKEYFPVRIRA